jgi:hypothetical protein
VDAFFAEIADNKALQLDTLSGTPARTPLMEAVRIGNLEFVRSVLARTKVNVNVISVDNKTALNIAQDNVKQHWLDNASEAHESIIELLKSKGAKTAFSLKWLSR